MWDDGDWEKKPILEGLNRHAGELVLQTFGNISEEYGSQVLAIQEALSVAKELGLNPIHIKVESEENIMVLDLVETDNKLLNKVLIVFSSLCLEVRALEEEFRTHYLGTILYYGEGDNRIIVLEGEAQLMISRILCTIQDLVGFVKRCYNVVQQIILQLEAFYELTRQNAKTLSPADLHMKDVLNHLGQLLAMLITLDELMMNHMTFRDHWASYVHTVTKATHDINKYGNQTHKAKMLRKLLCEISKVLLNGKIFQNVLQLTVDKAKPIFKSVEFADEMEKYIKNALNDVDIKMMTDPEKQTLLANVFGTYTLYVHLFGSSDKKLFKQFWEISKKVPSVTLCGNIVWFPDQFLCQHLHHLSNKLIDKKTREAVVAARISYIQTTSTNLPKLITTFSFQVFSWVIQMETTLKNLSQFKFDEVKIICNLYLEGIQIGMKTHKLLINITNLHGSMAKPMTKTSVAGLCRLVELLKAIEQMYERHSAAIARSITHIIQRLTFQILTITASVKKNLMGDKRFGERHVDKLSSLVVVEQCLSGPPTQLRLLTARLALSVANQRNTFKEEEATNLSTALGTLCRVALLDTHLTNTTNCNFLYWHRVILPVYFNTLSESTSNLQRIKYILQAVDDIGRQMNYDMQQRIMRPLSKEVTQHIANKITKPLCEGMETDLRLHAHSHLNSQELLFNVGIDPDVLLTPYVMMCGHVIDLKGNIEKYLEKTFYDLTTVALHDWRTYGEMRCLAEHKYNITTVEDTLPSQTLEQGLDVLEIMRNIHIFVSKYQYNLNNQIFIEYSSKNKHLNTINIRHIANSIRTHGTGIMNTTVNFTYQFLRKKLVIFSQFLYDEHIKSRLLKDLCFFRDNKNQLDSKYPFERAEKFNRGISRLGLTSDGLTYLDHFRILITQVGNAMGYVRMIRSGGLHCCSNAIRYLPELENIESLEDMVKEEGLSETCIQSARALDLVINNMGNNLTSSTTPTEYFKLLVDVFAPALQDQKNCHLWNFHLIVPPLTINFCEHLITAKEKMSKKSKMGAAFTDDGFAMGVAYMLSVLNLNTEMDSLHWFQSVKEKYCTELSNVSHQKQTIPKEDEKLIQTLNLTAKRLEIYKQEFELLFYSLSSAQVFFQRDLNCPTS